MESQKLTLLGLLYELKEERLMCRPRPSLSSTRVKFGVAVPHTTLSVKTGFRDDAIGDSRGLREGLNEFVPIFSMFLDRTGRNSVEVISTKFCWTVQSFVKIGEPKIMLHLRGHR